MGVSDGWNRPFEITLGEMKVAERTVRVFRRSIEFNGHRIDVDPHEVRDLFENLLRENPDFSDGYELPNDHRLKDFLIKSRAAYETSEGTFYPTTEFKGISHEFLKLLTKP